VPNFGVLIRMTDETPLLLAPRDKFVTLNIFDRKFSVNFPTTEDWSTKCVDLVVPDGLVFFSDGSLCGGRADSSVFSDILLSLLCYSLSIQSVCVFDVFGILHFGEHYQQSNINLL
jgi:hypothetical protein